MKSVESLERRSFLGLAAAAAAATPAMALPRSAPTSQTQKAVRIYPRTPVANLSRVDALFARAVRDLLSPELGTLASGSVRQRVRDRLVSAFRGSMSASALPPRWLWVWKGDHWEWVCLESASFEVRLSERLATIVEADDIEPMG